MNKLAWYKSNTLRALLVAAVVQLATWMGVSDVVTTESAQQNVDSVLSVIEFLAIAFAGWSRLRQPTPPITDAAAAKWKEQERKSTNVGASVRSPWLVSLLAGLLTILLLGCETTPARVMQIGCGQYDAGYQLERCADTIARIYHIYQQRALEIVQDSATPEYVKDAIKRADAEASPAARALIGAATTHLEIREQWQAMERATSELQAEKPDSERALVLRAQLADAERRLAQAAIDAAPVISRLIESIGG